MEDEKEKNIGPVQNAWGATTGLYKVTATKNETVNIYFPDYSVEMSFHNKGSEYLETMKKNFSSDIKFASVLSLRKSRSMTLTFKFEVFNNDEAYGIITEIEYLLVFNPNNATVTFHYDEKETQLDTRPSLKLNDKGYNQTTGPWVKMEYGPYNLHFVDSDDITPKTNLDEGVGDYKYLVTCDIDSESVPPNFPDIDVKLTRNTIFSEETEQYSFMTGGKLSGGNYCSSYCLLLLQVVLLQEER